LRLLVNIRGCNGAGKSTIPLSMMKDKKLQVVRVDDGDNKSPKLTVFPSYEWVALGTYYNRTGGLDTYKNNEDTRKALLFAWKKFPDYDILMEGVIASTIRSTYAELYTALERKVKKGFIIPRKIIIMNFLPPVETCIQRVYERNGGKPVNEQAIVQKWNTVKRNADYFKEQGFTSLKVNTAKVTKEQMLLKFLETCEKYREEE
jgi:hypothetical protein